MLRTIRQWESVGSAKLELTTGRRFPIAAEAVVPRHSGSIEPAIIRRKTNAAQ
jgi:hypothetical protein